MAEYLKLCIDKSLPPDIQIEAANTAVAEDVANLPVLSFRPGLGVAPFSPLEMAVLHAKKWKNGRVLKVRFMGGHPTVHAKVIEYAQRWSQFANVTFVFGNDLNADIRISFDLTDGSWSYLGTDALSLAANRPTMNYGWLTPETEDEEYSRVVQHEFGHALGCIHEHQHPQQGIPWDKQAVYNYYMGPPNNWPKSQVDSNIFAKYGTTSTNFSAFDRQSIMLYAIPEALTIGTYSVGWNRDVSDTDKSFIGTMYPKAPAKPVIDLDVNKPPVAAAIGAHGEEDLYRFMAPQAGTYTVETSGPTDVIMALLSQDQLTVIAEDDDSGQGLNARIAKQLASGTYHVRVRHFRPTGKGNYSIAIVA